MALSVWRDLSSGADLRDKIVAWLLFFVVVKKLIKAVLNALVFQAPRFLFPRSLRRNYLYEGASWVAGNLARISQ